MFSKGKFKSTKERGDFLLQCNLVRDKKKKEKNDNHKFCGKDKVHKNGIIINLAL